MKPIIFIMKFFILASLLAFHSIALAQESKMKKVISPEEFYRSALHGEVNFASFKSVAIWLQEPESVSS